MAKRAFTPRHIPLAHRYPSVMRDHWTLDATKLPHEDDLNVQSKVILVLGEPQLELILPLLYSRHLVSSLVVVVTARSYKFPTNISPSVAILRLRKPLSTSDSAAPRLVSILQWADRVASAWRNHPAPPPIQELSEDAPTAGYLTPPPQRSSWFSSGAIIPSSSDSDHTLSRPSSRLSRYSSARGGSSTSLSTLTKTAKPPKSAQRHAFDSLFNFLPPDASDQHLLKYVILVTTISRPFLTCTLPTLFDPGKKERRRFSFRTRTISESDVSASSSISPAHIVHLVPLSRTTLLRPLESFCLTFAHPVARPDQHLNVPVNVDIGVPGPPPRPFILPPIALGEVLPISRKWTVAELILCGALNGNQPGSTSGQPSYSNTNSQSVRDSSKSRRAWLSGAGDILVTGAGRAFQKSAYVPSGLKRSNVDWHESGVGKLAGSGAGLDVSSRERSEKSMSSSQSVTGLPTPPESDSSESGETIRRKGIFRWLKR